MKNYESKGNVLTLTAPYQRNSGEGAQVGTLFGVATTNVANAVAAEFAIVGVFTLTKSTGASTGGAQGAAAYWDNTAKSVTAVSTSNLKIGHFAATCANGDATAKVRVNGASA